MLKDKAREGFAAGMAKADGAQPAVNMVVAGCMMLMGAFGFFYVVMHGPNMLLLRIGLMLVCFTVCYQGFKSFKMWLGKLNEAKDGENLTSLINRAADKDQ